MNARGAQRRFIAVFIAPAFLLYSVFVFYPSLRALGYSLQRWDGLTDPEWVGLQHFAALFQPGALFLAALWHNVLLTVAAGGLTIALALLFAAALHRRVRGAAVYRVTFFFPNVIAAVAVALLWLLLYSATDFGVINAGLRMFQQGAVSIGIEAARDWEIPFPFLSSQYLLFAIIPMIVWMWTGFYMVLFLAGMEGIPESYYEAARLDGASPFAQFWHITLPLLRDILAVGAVFLVISSLKFFDPIWVLENQRPTRDSHVLATLLYQKVFTEYDVGQGAAVAVLLFVLVFFATLVSLRIARKERIEY